jgi:hypothetical protein
MFFFYIALIIEGAAKMCSNLERHRRQFTKKSFVSYNIHLFFNTTVVQQVKNKKNLLNEIILVIKIGFVYLLRAAPLSLYCISMGSSVGTHATALYPKLSANDHGAIHFSFCLQVVSALNFNGTMHFEIH